MQRENVTDLKVWTSSMQRTIQTAALFENVTSFKALDEVNAGQFEGSTYEEIKDKHPQVGARARVLPRSPMISPCYVMSLYKARSWMT